MPGILRPIDLRDFRDYLVLRVGFTTGLRVAALSTSRCKNLIEDSGHHVLRVTEKRRKVVAVVILPQSQRGVLALPATHGAQPSRRPSGPHYVEVQDWLAAEPLPTVTRHSDPGVETARARCGSQRDHAPRNAGY